MHNHHPHRLGKAVSVSFTFVAALLVAYVGLIAVIMGYAATTVDFAQSVTNDKAVIAQLDGQYFAAVSAITGTSYAAAGYREPALVTYVPQASETALR